MSEEIKPDEIAQPQEEINAASTDIAATEVESYQIAVSSDPVLSTADNEESGATETLPAIETIEVVESGQTENVVAPIAPDITDNIVENVVTNESLITAEASENEEVETPVEVGKSDEPEEAPTAGENGKLEAPVEVGESGEPETGLNLELETPDKVDKNGELNEALAADVNGELETSVEIGENGEPDEAPAAGVNEELETSVEVDESGKLDEAPAADEATLAVDETVEIEDLSITTLPTVASNLPVVKEKSVLPEHAEQLMVDKQTDDGSPTADIDVTLPAALESTVLPPQEDITEASEPIAHSTLLQTSTQGDGDVAKTADQSISEEITTERSEFPGVVSAGETQRKPNEEFKEEVKEDKEEKDATATVKFHLLPSYQVITVASPLSQSIEQLKEQLSAEAKVPSIVLQFALEGKSLSDALTLKDLNVQPNGTIQLDVTSSNPVESPLRTSQTRPVLGSSDVITVRLIKDNNDYEDVVVEIDRSYRKKPFLGGYRHKLTGVEYHHASSQTLPKPIEPSSIPKYNRNTQTVYESNRRTQTTNTTSTQMTKTGCYVSIKEDKILYAKKYFTSEEYFLRRLKAVIVLQSYFRRWQARNIVNELRQDRDRRLRWEEEEELRKRREKEMRIKKEFERRMNPKSKEDFDVVYAALEKWRLEELAQINAELDGPERKAALCALLDQETQLIASIGRHKLEASKENKERNIENFLSKAAAPKRWKAYDGRFTEMDTQYTIRAKEMKDIYNSINMKYLTQDERLDILLTLKHTVKEHDCKLTRDIIELIDREADLLMRGVSDSNLEGLRKRISTLFLQYCKNPLFNPEAARLLKVPQDPSTLRKNIYFCASTNEYLPSTEFKITSNSRKVGKSRKVQEMDNIARTRQDYSHYRIMLRDLRRTEEAYEDDSNIAYLIQEKDLQYLVENVWCAQSILSAWDDLFDLVLVRWDKEEEWSPWNCILLTKDEAVSHSRIDHLYEAYGQVFVHKIKHKHVLARIYFSKIPGISEQLRKKMSGSLKMQGPAEIRGKQALSMT